MPPDAIEQALDAAAAHDAAGRLPAAERTLLEVLARAPHHAVALHRLAVLVGRTGRVDRAIDLLRRSIAAKPTDAVAHYHLGVAVSQKGHLSAAAEAFTRAVALRPDLADAHANLAMTWLLTGDYDRGLPEYEWRTGTAAFVRPPPVPQPMWDGSPLAGRTLLLRAEQGFGDTLQFARYAPLLRDRFGGQVVLEVQRPLRRLLDGYPGTNAVIATGDPVPPVDVWLPLLSGMRVMGTRPGTIPGCAPLRAPPAAAAAWAGRIPIGGRRLGLAWAGSPTNTNDRNRSVPVEALAPLLAVPGVRWFGLQTGPAAAARPAGVTDLVADVRDFADTAAVVEQLDGVVTVDTAVAHLAGSMGKPVWLMVPFLPDWRWGLGRADTPWYPTVRLFRQPAYAAWPPVVAALAGALA